MSLNQDICREAVRLGASLAGIAPVETLKRSPCYEIYDRSPYYEGYTGVSWPEDALSVLVLALVHDPGEPELDWWSEAVPGRTPGNRILMRISRRCRTRLRDLYGITATPLPYPVERGGIFLKDAAVLAGLGVIGKNNLLITPQFGTRVRLRALFLDRDVQPSPPLDYDPCAGCPAPCHEACPERAFKSGRYDVTACHREMERNRSTFIEVAGSSMGIEGRCMAAPFCRACELACPAGAGA